MCGSSGLSVCDGARANVERESAVSVSDGMHCADSRGILGTALWGVGDGKAKGGQTRLTTTTTVFYVSKHKLKVSSICICNALWALVSRKYVAGWLKGNKMHPWKQETDANCRFNWNLVVHLMQLNAVQ